MILYESFLHHFSKNLLQCKAPVYSHLSCLKVLYVNFTTFDHQPYCVLYRNLTDLNKVHWPTSVLRLGHCLSWYL